MPPQQYWKIRKTREVIRSGRIKMVYVIMKSIKNLYFAVVLVVLAVGCSKLDSGMEQKSSPIFRASFEANEEEDVNEPGQRSILIVISNFIGMQMMRSLYSTALL